MRAWRLVLLLAADIASRGASSAILLNHTLPTRVQIQTGDLLSSPPGAGPTPSSQTRRHLSEEYNDRDMHSRTRTLLLDPYLFAGIDIDDLYFQIFDPIAVTFTLPPEFVQYLKSTLFNSTASTGQHILDSAPSLTFHSTWRKDVFTGVANGIFVFNQEASAFLDIMATSGNTYAFRQAVLLLPDDEIDSAAPSYATSVTGFKPASPKHPTLVRLSSKRASNTVPDVSMRFDYTSPLDGGYDFSLYFTTLGSTAPPKGLAQANLKMSHMALTVGGIIESVKELVKSSG